MRRREFVAGLGSAVAWPLAARAQQSAMPVIGLLSAAGPEVFNSARQSAFRRGLSESGYVNAQNILFEYRWAEGQFDRLGALASDLIQRRVAVVVATGVTSARVAKVASSVIPILVMAGDDPVKFGLVASLNRPGGNVTGLNLMTSELAAKRLGLVRQLVSTPTIVAILSNPKSPESEPQIRDLVTAASTIGQEIHVLSASTESDIRTAFGSLVQPAAGALVVTNDPFLYTQRDQIVALAAQHAIPAIYDRSEYTAIGGLISYGTNYVDGYRQIGAYAGRILTGDNPADLPVMQPTKFSLAINLKTAKALDLPVPPNLLALADEVIE